MSTATQPPLVSTRCHTTMLRVTNLERSIEWFERVLGAKIVHRDPAYRVVEFRTPCGAHLSIWEVRAHERLIPASIETPYVVFVTDDIVEYRRSLEAVQATVSPIVRGMGMDIFWFADPDNNQYCVLHFNPE